MVDFTVTLSADELGEVLAMLESSHHGQDGGDYEPECPACTAAEKLKAALAGFSPGYIQSNKPRWPK